jgi:hypothetical protein
MGGVGVVKRVTETDFDRSKHVFRSPDFHKIVDEAVKFLCASPVHFLPPTLSFKDAGVYALYYQGDFTAYAKLAEKNSHGFNQPIYVGKAVPRGWRTSRTNQSGENSLYSRLREHARSISQTKNLALENFACRFMILESEETDLISTVEAELIRRFRPLWNCVIDGFGNHDPGSGRYDQRVSEWDALHSGRSWAEKLKGGVPILSDIEKKIQDAISSL